MDPFPTLSKIDAEKIDKMLKTKDPKQMTVYVQQPGSRIFFLTSPIQVQQQIQKIIKSDK
ncbi:hypothetical protein DERF_013480 [Dermatophagoides farinae]|uniref:Uncharacterized protein n=1 Tax=Dermatophagoides farinae TaxID=6954 RepID=A0A922KVB0_DERFA|nr:hypothetical protein HUG17_1134 [Dermatophagoides farinae]KAH9497491.1 hypothetical protein DERF_013480 [Dermatophagoides farinae]